MNLGFNCRLGRRGPLPFTLAACLAYVLASTGCGSTASTSTSPSPVKCKVSLSASDTSLSAGGATGSIQVSTEPECAWTASSQANWISGLAPASGQGSAALAFQVDSNPDPAVRQGDVVVNGEHASIRQEAAACEYELSSTSQGIGASGGDGTLTVTTRAGCPWTARSDASWIAIVTTGPSTGTGNVAFTVAANTGDGRVGTVAIADKTFTVSQGAPPPPSPSPIGCMYDVDPSSHSFGAAGGTAAVSVTSTCSWTATSNAGWLTVVSGRTGTGSDSITVSAAPNVGPSRSAVLTVANQDVIITQAGAPNCSYALNSNSQTAPASGGMGTPISVTTLAGCAWTATSNASWLTVTSGANGSGSGAVSFTVASNSGSARSGTLSIAGQTVTVTQSGSCTYTVAPTSQTATAAGGSGTPITVTTVAGCSWTATPTVAWISITSGASGTGNGTVGVSVAANSGGARTGTVTIADKTVTVNQSGGCTYSVNPTSETIATAGGTGTPVAVTAANGCAWTATSNAAWLSITSGASGSGNGTVAFTAAANTAAARSGTLTVAGQTVTISQGAATCSYSASPTSQSVSAVGITGAPITVTTTTGCAWTAQSNVSWVTILTGSSGSGSGTVTFTVLPNTGSSSRSGTLTVAGQTVTITQAAACVYVIAPTSQSFGDKGGTSGSVAVTTTPGCTWTATSNASWITVTSGASGSGPGSVTFRVDANMMASNRSGTLTIAGQTFSVSQDKK